MAAATARNGEGGTEAGRQSTIAWRVGFSGHGSAPRTYSISQPPVRQEEWASSWLLSSLFVSLLERLGVVFKPKVSGLCFWGRVTSYCVDLRCISSYFSRRLFYTTFCRFILNLNFYLKRNRTSSTRVGVLVRYQNMTRESRIVLSNPGQDNNITLHAGKQDGMLSRVCDPFPHSP